MTTSSDYTAKQAHAAVARGAAWLDEHCPDWFKEIRLERLNLASPTFCVLGQTAKCLLGIPNPKRTAMRDGFNDVVYQHSRGWAGHHGFNATAADGTDFDIEIEMLQIAWEELIRQRLEARTP